MCLSQVAVTLLERHHVAHCKEPGNTVTLHGFSQVTGSGRANASDGLWDDSLADARACDQNPNSSPGPGCWMLSRLCQTEIYTKKRLLPIK